MPAGGRQPGAGRPTKDSLEKRQVIIQAIENKMPRYLAAEYAMITRETLRQWLAKDQDFLAQVQFAEAKAAGALINKVAEDGNGAWKILKNLKPEHFKDEVQVQQTNNYAILLNDSDGKGQEIRFDFQPAPGADGVDTLQEADTVSDLGDSGRQINPGSLLAVNKASKDTKER